MVDGFSELLIFAAVPPGPEVFTGVNAEKLLR
jgi:hypothetical protein